MIDDDDVEPGFGRGGKRLMRGSAAIDRDNDRRPVSFEAQESRRIWAIAFAHAIRDIERGGCADGSKEAQQQRGGCRAVDIVIAEHDDRRAIANGP